MSGRGLRFAVCGLALLLGACSQPVTRENFDRIEQGMARDAVFDLLGEPTEMNAMKVGEIGGTTARWEGGGRVIIILFANGEVVYKSYGHLP